MDREYVACKDRGKCGGGIAVIPIDSGFADKHMANILGNFQIKAQNQKASNPLELLAFSGGG